MMHYQRFVSKEITIFVFFISAHKYQSLYLTIYISIYLSIYLPTYLSTYLPIYLSIYRPLCLFYPSIYQLLVVALSTFCNTGNHDQHFVSKKITILTSIYQTIYLSTYPLSIYACIYTSIYLSTCICIYQTIYLSIYVSNYPPFYPSISLLLMLHYQHFVSQGRHDQHFVWKLQSLKFAFPHININLSF